MKTTPTLFAFYAFVLSLTVFSSCQPSEEDCANALVSQAQQMVHAGQWRQALIVLDSVHSTYPRQVAQRRQAKALSDSIHYLEAQQTLAYTDTLLPPLLEQVDKLIRQFKYEKDERYENVGKYVHKLLSTNKNDSRNFLQSYVQDNHETIVKSYYYGTTQVGQASVCLSADGEEQIFAGSNHHFEAEGHHEIMTLQGDPALALLNFISSHYQSRIRVEGRRASGKSGWVYYLGDNEKQALSQTYQLGWLMKDIKRIEQMQQSANRIIGKWEADHPQTCTQIQE